MEEYVLNEENISYQTKRIKYIINADCWECISHSSHTNNGYLSIGRNKKRYLMHRYIYEMQYGLIPEDKVIMHICDNPKCININHLKLGTQKENIKDMINKGRRNPNSIPKKKLNEQQLLKIKEMLLNKTYIREIEEQFPVSGYVISRIKQGKSIYSEFLGGGFNDWMAEKVIEEEKGSN